MVIFPKGYYVIPYVYLHVLWVRTTAASFVIGGDICLTGRRSRHQCSSFVPLPPHHQSSSFSWDLLGFRGSPISFSSSVFSTSSLLRTEPSSSSNNDESSTTTRTATLVPSLESAPSLSTEEEEKEEEEPFFFIRRAQVADLGFVSKILADGFYSDRSWFMYQYEKFETYLNLESTFPRGRYQHDMWVACDATSGQVLAFCEIDNREMDYETQKRKHGSVNMPRPYMYNLAVDQQHQRRGLAKALIHHVEQQCSDQWNCSAIHLKARQENAAATGLYAALGYQVSKEETDPKNPEKTLLWMTKEI